MKRLDAVRRAIRLPLMLLAAALVLGPAIARAQGGGGDGPGGRLEDALLRTDEQLARAEEIVDQSGSERAHVLLQAALRLQEGAWERFHGNQLLIAARRTQEAREAGARAVRLARQDDGLRERATREVELAERSLAQSQDSDFEPPPPAQRMLREAAMLSERARLQLQEQRFEAALRLAVSARRMLRQADALSGGDRDRPRVLRELERTDHLIERVEPVIGDSGDDAAAALLEKGTNLQERAWQSWEDGKARLAFVETREARSLANRAHQQVSGPLDAAFVEAALVRTEERLERASEEVGGSDRPVAQALLRRAQERQRLAHDLFDAGDLRGALAQTRIAGTLAARAGQLAKEAGGER
ncbi:MAG: hypothetical protein KC591_10850 [Gemmatimonadetes bacterium]|nr:hypothetical protein [Gemmatimonadota bacterium]